MTKILSKEPQYILTEGKPTAVILSIHDYKELLEKVEDIYDLKELRRMKRMKLEFRPFEEFIKENA